MESNHQFDHNRYDEHQSSSSSEEEKNMHDSAIMDLNHSIIDNHEIESSEHKSRS